MGGEVKQLGLTRTTEQSLLSLAFDLGGIIAGLTVAAYLGLFLREPWIIALYPGIISLRGVIGGLFAGRLSTGLHLGTIPASLSGSNTKRFYLLWGSTIVLTFESSLLLGLVAALFQMVSAHSLNILTMLTIFGTLFATMGLSILVISPLTIAIAFSSFRKGLDPDIIVYPIESTMADILVTICYLIVLNLLLSGTGLMIIALVCIVFTGFVLGIFYRSRGETEFLRTLKESFYMIVVVAIIVNITGQMLSTISKINEFVGQKSKIYVVYPAIIDTIGDVGAIVGSTATTKLALGSLDSSIRSIKNHRTQIAAAWLASAAMFTIYAFISSLYEPSSSILEALTFLFLLLATNLLAGGIMVIISFSVAILTFKRGLDPDNFVIPLESSLADAITTLSLFVMLSIIGGL
jgi:mgtE-like transporter